MVTLFIEKSKCEGKVQDCLRAYSTWSSAMVLYHTCRCRLQAPSHTTHPPMTHNLCLSAPQTRAAAPSVIHHSGQLSGALFRMGRGVCVARHNHGSSAAAGAAVCLGCVEVQMWWQESLEGRQRRPHRKRTSLSVSCVSCSADVLKSPAAGRVAPLLTTVRQQQFT
ncbi:hypothetical protein E2C01_009632 [Portunus trituberculatus]|uniref:Uncharacterized protein n=1 Tax=Portunus trituberculatus TaxID=210409 RepID=A0A5B7D6B0_PORTR|nr:hypothetical protein [Portunus trituberculatus]